MRLYELGSQYQRIRDLAEMAGTEEEAKAFQDTLEGITGELDEKVDRIAALMTEFDADCDALKNEEARLEARRKSIESNRARLAEYTLHCLQDAGIQKCKGPRFTVMVAQNPPRVVVDEESKIPPAFWLQKPVLDRASIAAELKANREVPGAHLERGESLRVR